VDGEPALTKVNLQFIEAFRCGSWELLEPILSPPFSYLDGATGEVWAHERYVENLRRNPVPSLAIDQVSVPVDGDTAVVSARTSRQPGERSRLRRHLSATRGPLVLCSRLRLAPSGPD